MADNRSIDRGEQIESLMAAAREERAHAIRGFLQSLFQRRRDVTKWHPAAKPAVNECG
jgi:hypothetical protein